MPLNVLRRDHLRASRQEKSGASSEQKREPIAPDPTNPSLGSFHIDGTEFETYAEDVPPGALLGLVTTQEGFTDACSEFITSHSAYGKAAGIPDGDIADLTEANERIARIDAFLPAYLKAAEILTETRAKLDDKRQRILLNGAKSVDRRAGQNATILAKYEKTREYRSVIAKKALKTKAKKAALADETGTPGAPPDAPAVTPTP